MKLFTWDYVAINSLLDGPLPATLKVGGAVSDRPHLVEAGLMAPKVEPIPEKERSYGRDAPTTKTIFHITDAGRAWLTKIKAKWDKETEGTTWWSVELGRGCTIIGIPSDLHPEDVDDDLRLLLGMHGGLAEPRDEDHSPGNPRKLTRTEVTLPDGARGKVPWKPWHDASQAWIDCRRPGRPFFRGAYMRPHGAPFDPGLSFIECCGLFPTGLKTIDEADAKHISYLDTIEIPQATSTETAA